MGRSLAEVKERNGGAELYREGLAECSPFRVVFYPIKRRRAHRDERKKEGGTSVYGKEEKGTQRGGGKKALSLLPPIRMPGRRGEARKGVATGGRKESNRGFLAKKEGTERVGR